MIITFSFTGPTAYPKGEMVTAYEAYYQAIEQFNLPASIPVITDSGEAGLATQAIDFLENEKAFQMIFSEDRMERAKAAIYACQHTLGQIHDNFEDLTTP